MALMIGITGSIGCGKSFFSSLFDPLYFDIIPTDLVSKELLTEPSVREQLVHLFSAQILDHQGQISPSILGSIVFNDKKKLDRLNQLLHPMVTQKVKAQLEQSKKNTIIESALLFQSELDKLCHINICIHTDMDIAVRRVKSRGTYLSEREIQKIIKSQNESNRFQEQADIVINNNSNTMLLENKFNRLLLALKELKYEF